MAPPPIASSGRPASPSAARPADRHVHTTARRRHLGSMETGGGSESPPPVKEEDPPVTVGSSIPTAEKREVCLISSRRPTPQGQSGEEADGEERKEDGASTRARIEPEVIEGVQVPVAAGVLIANKDEVEDRMVLVADDVPSPVEKEEGPVAEGSKSLTPEAVAEIAENFFKCPVCRCLTYDPAVIACGHILCVGCIQNSMNIIESSECPLCHNLYNYLPRSCELIHDLVMKLQPLEVGTEETQEGDDKVMEPTYAYQCSVQKEDVSCVLCHGLLYQHTVLNCGHVFCISCIGGEATECPACGTHHPCGPLAICWYLDNFIQDFFSSAYKSRMKETQPFSGTTKKREIMNSNSKLSHTHVGVGCDFCGIYPIKGDRFSCKTCKYDLCTKCAMTDSPVEAEGRSGQLHLPDHALELNTSFLLSKVLSVLDNKEEPKEKGTWEWRPAQLLPWVGGWDQGQQAPQDEDGNEPEDSASEDDGFGNESEDSSSEDDGSGNESENTASEDDGSGNESENSASEDDG